jgi:hypothetical protein
MTLESMDITEPDATDADIKAIRVPFITTSEVDVTSKAPNVKRTPAAVAVLVP